MQTWLLYAILSMVFAGVTAILAKYGLQNIGADFGLTVRTSVIFFIVTVMSMVSQNYKEYFSLTRTQLFLLIASGVTTTLSWIFYYRAIKRRTGFICGSNRQRQYCNNTCFGIHPSARTDQCKNTHRWHSHICRDDRADLEIKFPC